MELPKLTSLLYTAILFFSTSVFAGTIKGKVSDEKSGEPLTGATVQLLVNGKNRFAIVNLDGSYTFRNITKGKYLITAKYIGYVTSPELDVVVASEADVVNIDMQLNQGSAELSEVVISSSGTRGSDESVRRIEKNANTIQNILSERAIQLSPDITVANSLQRISGVTIERSSSGEGRYASLRDRKSKHRLFQPELRGFMIMRTGRLLMR